MKTIEFTEIEAKLVKEVLERERRELQPEIHRTDTTSLRYELKSKYHTLNRLIERLAEGETTSACACKNA